LARVEPFPERSHLPCMTGKAKKPPSEALQRFLNEGGTTRAGELSRKKRPREESKRPRSVLHQGLS
jgi:hypothetical protein